MPTTLRIFSYGFESRWPSPKATEALCCMVKLTRRIPFSQVKNLKKSRLAAATGCIFSGQMVQLGGAAPLTPPKKLPDIKAPQPV
jgi:hypothetical protein